MNDFIWLILLLSINFGVLLFLNKKHKKMFPNNTFQKSLLNIILFFFFLLSGMVIIASTLETIDVIKNDMIYRSGNPSADIIHNLYNFFQKP
ncbi:hypothetical protein N783_05750 [Pontibacillus marinus BH030004 = DSM 16465]|uniref:Uncharacterized protein n=1 Tax=Pontibacillus marinus BH030004 = DSM 16465 TaxID=1385511 RepID=A0A0A5FTG9_9BACI|nr:hypothetical protein N783_05750 [Pontibacillus marinus BH030004 = DSM 16465]